MPQFIPKFVFGIMDMISGGFGNPAAFFGLEDIRFSSQKHGMPTIFVLQFYLHLKTNERKGTDLVLVPFRSYKQGCRGTVYECRAELCEPSADASGTVCMSWALSSPQHGPHSPHSSGGTEREAPRRSMPRAAGK